VFAFVVGARHRVLLCQEVGELKIKTLRTYQHQRALSVGRDYHSKRHRSCKGRTRPLGPGIFAAFSVRTYR
jgi:hypothetical protein